MENNETAKALIESLNKQFKKDGWDELTDREKIIIQMFFKYIPINKNMTVNEIKSIFEV